MITMLKSLVPNNNNNMKEDNNLKQKEIEKFETRQQIVSQVNIISNEIKEKLNDNSEESDIINADFNIESTINNFKKLSIGPGVIDRFDEIKIKNSTIGENKSVDHQNRKLLDQIESLHCLFTWKLKSRKELDTVRHIENKYGANNLDISLPEFTFARFVGNLIISYELYLNGDSDANDLKMLEIGKWLEMLEKGTDEFYLSINIGLKHIMMANFIHMQFAANDVRGFKQLFEEIVSFDDMDNKSKAAIYATHAAILIEYGENLDCFKNACEYAKKACVLDPQTSHWFHIYSLVLITQRQFVLTLEYTKDKLLLLANKSYLAENEIILAIQKAVTFSSIKSTFYVNSLVLTGLNQFSINEFQVKSDEVPVLKQDISEENRKSNLEEDMKIIVQKHKNGKDAVPYLNALVSKYKHDKWKIMAQICSYTILFSNNFRASIEQFLLLIKEPGISTSELMHHTSPFINDSKQLNLVELIRSEIRFATANSNNTSFEDMLYYYKIFFIIEETCIPKIKNGIPTPPRATPVSNLITKSTCSSTSINYQDKPNSSINESDSSNIYACSSVSRQDEYNKSNDGNDVDKSKNIINKQNAYICKPKQKHLQNTGPKLFTNKPQLDQKKDTTKNYLKTESVLKNATSKMQSNDMSLKDVILLSNIFENVCPSTSYPLLAENLNHFLLQIEMYNFQLQNNLQNITNQNPNTYFDQNFVHFGFFQQYQCSTLIPSLLDLKLDPHFPPNIYTNNDSINSGTMTFDTSLTKLPRLSTSQTTYQFYLKCILLNYPNSFKIYTDASKIQNNVGIAMVSDKDTFTLKLSSDYTSCEAEAVAILLALEYALAENYVDYLILTDSLTTVTCIQKENNSSDVINSIFLLIRINQLKGNRIHFIWIPGHNSIEGNEKADRLAKKIATTQTSIIYNHNSFMKSKLNLSN